MRAVLLREISLRATSKTRPSAGIDGLARNDATWELMVHPAAWIQDRHQASPSLAYAIILVDEEGMVRASDLVGGKRPLTKDVLSVVRRGCARPAPPCAPARPACIVVDAGFSSLMDALKLELDAWGIAASSGLTHRAHEAAEAMLDATFEGAPCWLRHETDEAILAFTRASVSFLSARPWRNVRPDTLIEVRIGTRDPVYATLMGNGGTGEVGFVVHGELADALRMRDATSPDDAIGSGVESTSMIPIAAVHPADGDRLAALNLLPERDEIFLPMRIERDGPARPRLPLAAHAAILEAVAFGVKDANGSTERDIDGTHVALAWPTISSVRRRTGHTRGAPRRR